MLFVGLVIEPAYTNYAKKPFNTASPSMMYSEPAFCGEVLKTSKLQLGYVPVALFLISDISGIKR